MRRGILVAVLCLTASAIPVSGQNPGQDLEDMVARLRGSDTVCCSLIGFAHTPSEQYALYESIAQHGSRQRVGYLLTDENPVVRCVGLFAVAKEGSDGAVATLREHFSDRGVVYFQAYDIVSSMTVGTFAMMLIQDTNCLVSNPLTPGYQHPYAPLRSKNELMAMDLEVLASDLSTALHELAAYDLAETEEAGQFVLELQALRRRAPSLKAYQVIKAVGRQQPSEIQRAFLLRCLQMDGLDVDAKCAAASALTRQVDEAALEAQRLAMEAADGSHWAGHLLDQFNARQAFETNLQPVRADRSWRAQEKIKDKVLLAFTTNRCLAIDDLLDPPAPVLVREQEDVRQAVAGSLVAISGNLESVSQPWNTYSNTAVKLDLLIRRIRFYRESERRRAERWAAEGHQALPQTPQLLTEVECQEIEANIAGFLRELSK